MRDDINNHPRDPRYLDLAAALALVVIVAAVLALTNRGLAIAPFQTAGVDQYVRW